MSNEKSTTDKTDLSKILEIRKSIVRESMEDINQAEHRFELIGEYMGIEFINDSKATTVDLTWQSLQRIEKPIIWIAGGLDTGGDYDNLKPLVADKVKGIVCLSRDSKKLFNTFFDLVNVIVSASTAEEALRVSAVMAHSGYVVLLSPAGSSFDLFDSYQDRGNKFKKAFKKLLINPNLNFTE